MNPHKQRKVKARRMWLVDIPPVCAHEDKTYVDDKPVHVIPADAAAMRKGRADK